MARRVNIFGQPLSYDVGVTYVGPTPTDRDRPVVEGDDLSGPTKATLAKYADDLTHGVEGSQANANTFPVAGVPQVTSIQTPDGTTPPASANASGAGQFAGQFTRPGRILNGTVEAADPRLFEVNDSDFTQDHRGDSAFIKKGKSKSGDVTGHRVLLGPVAEVDPRVSERFVSPILENNRFSSSRRLTSIVGNDKKFNPEHLDDGKGSYKKHSKLGTDLTDGQIANVGPMLSLRATKELNSLASGGYGQGGPDGVAAKASSLLPGLAQVGAARVATDDLQADSVLRALIEGDVDGVNIAAGDPGPRTVISMDSSYGQMNNTLERFSGLLPLGMVAAGVALSLALNVAMRAVLSVFLLITNASSSNSVKRDDLGRFIPGDSRFNPAFSKVTFPPVPLPAKLFGLVETVNPYGDAVTEGITAFFGGRIGDRLTRVLESPGFYVVFSRNIVRSATELARGLGNVGRGDVISVAENIVGFIDVIKSSKVVAVMNMFAQIGDLSLQQKARLERFEPDQTRTGDSELDNLEGLNAMRNRKPGSLALAWGASTTRSSLVLPRSVAKALLSGRPGALTNLMSNRSGVEFGVSATGRMSAEHVVKVEEELNAEYVPFYFHDLRTNEIVSFHAFLSNLAEDYTPNYDSVDGVGRVDSVKMYKSTVRKISIAFFVAATNPEDFDAMWLKINKLTTLVYPQWSRGTLLRDGDGNQFTQPFSQMPTASPLMRFRVGDLWKTNYSKFSLARIFGLGDDSTFKLEKFTHPLDTSVYDKTGAIKDLLAQLKNNNGELKIGTEWMLEPGDYEASPLDQGALGAAASAVASIASTVGVKVATPRRVTIRLRVPTQVILSKAFNSTAYAVEVKDKEGIPADVANAQFIVSRSHLSISDRTLFTYGVRESFLGEDPLAENQKVDRTVSLAQFFSAENNAIVKAYEAAKGRGLAGIVESLSFDWFEGGNATWETGREGARAPKMCKVSMTFGIIHDIAPGIDANGFNRAPIYTVGGPSNAMAGNLPADEGNAFQASAKKVRRSLL